MHLSPVAKNTSIAGIDVDLKTGMSEEEMEAFAPLAKGLVLKVCRGPVGEAQEGVTQSNAILRTLATAKPDSLLYGRTDFESAEVCVCGCTRLLACCRLFAFSLYEKDPTLLATSLYTGRVSIVWTG